MGLGDEARDVARLRVAFGRPAEQADIESTESKTLGSSSAANAETSPPKLEPPTVNRSAKLRVPAPGQQLVRESG